MGVIRYMGETDFAKGEWCGVELDEPLGKNDGAVAGTRYIYKHYACSKPPKFLFSFYPKRKRRGRMWIHLLGCLCSDLFFNETVQPSSPELVCPIFYPP